MDTIRFMISQRKQAEDIARSYHAGQTDKAGAPYMKHLEAVADAFSNDTLQAIAWLHDILEDTDLDSENLRSFGFPEEIIKTVVDLTRIPGEDYEDYIRRLSHNPLAVQVKLADLHHNMDLSRLPEVTLKDIRRLEKYQKAESFLRQIDTERQNHES